MHPLGITLKKFFTRTKIEVIVSVLAISIVGSHGYAYYKEFIDNEALEIETSIMKAAADTLKSSSTTIPIIVYHKIGKPELLGLNRKPTQRYSVDSDVFESQVEFIQNQGYTPLTMQELIRDEQLNTLPPKPIVLTFDDGWRSQYENGLPILIKHHIPATFYIYTGVIDCPLYMTWDNLRSLVSVGMEIGDHTKHHPRLAKIDPSKLDDEILGSKQDLENSLHISVADFAYPYGNYNDTVVEAIKRAGYISARTSDKGIYNDFKDMYKLNVLYGPSDLRAFEEMLTQK